MDKQVELVEIERKDAVAIVRLNAEHTRNSLSNGMRAALAAALAQVGADTEVRAVYLTSRGPNFCSGGDLRALDEVRDDAWAVHRRFRDMGRWLLPFMRIEKPVIAGVRGYAVGGGFGLALAADLVIASDTAKFMASWMRMGIMPDALAMYTLPRLIGLAKARRLFITEEALDPFQAQELDLVAEVVPDDQLDARGIELAQAFAAGPADVWGLTKLVLSRTFETGIDDMFLLEGLGQVVAMGGPEFGQRLRGFLDKQPPRPSVGDKLKQRGKAAGPR
ncbi:MAG: enoyl-CoA hydratase/isomerase family protein [Rubrivivax sp.]